MKSNFEFLKEYWPALAQIAKGIYYMEPCVIYIVGQNGGFKAFTEMCND